MDPIPRDHSSKVKAFGIYALAVAGAYVLYSIRDTNYGENDESQPIHLQFIKIIPSTNIHTVIFAVSFVFVLLAYCPPFMNYSNATIANILKHGTTLSYGGIFYGFYHTVTNYKVKLRSLKDEDSEQRLNNDFIAAVQAQKESLIRQMVELYPDLHLYDMILSGGNSVLHIAVAQQNHELINYWLICGVSPNHQNVANGDTPLHIAVRMNDVEAVECLMTNGADADILNEKEQSASATARMAGYTDIIGVLSLYSSSLADVEQLVLATKEVNKHNNIKNGIWIIIGGNVYDITQFIESKLHPASNAFIAPYFGQDATEAYDASFHSIQAANLLAKYQIGVLPDAEAEINVQNGNLASMSSRSLRPSLSRFKLRDTKSNTIYVSTLFVYPVKGCKGISVESAQLTTSGFVDDRIYAFVSKKNHRIVNQLTYPRLALIDIAFKSGTSNCDSGIQLNDFFVPFVKDVTLRVEWKSSTSEILVYDQGESASKWITSYLSQDEEFLLVRVHEDNYRETEDYFALNMAPKSSQQMSGIQNYTQVLLASEESLSELNRRYEAHELCIYDDDVICWDRFRNNIIVSGVPAPHYEDFMKHISFRSEFEKAAELLWSRRRYFCAMPQINQNNAQQTSHPALAIKRYRNAMTLNDRTSLPGDDAVFFGSFYQVKHDGIIRVGQSVICKHERLEYDTLRTASGKSFFGLTEANIGSQFDIDYFSQYEKFELLSREHVNHNVIRVRFKMKCDFTIKESLKEAMKMGDHYLLKHDAVIRAYTPVFGGGAMDDMCFDLLVKVYKNGKMSSHLNNMQIGESILCKKNYGKVCYTQIGRMRFGDPRFTMFLPYTLNVNKLNLIAAGSGITPIYQILCNIHANRHKDQTQIVFFYANVEKQDILMKDELINIATTNDNIDIHFVIEREEEELKVNGIENKYLHKGRISNEICDTYLFPPNKSEFQQQSDYHVVTLICGPPPMEKGVKKYIYNMGHNEKSVSTF